MSKFLRSTLCKLEAYTPGEQPRGMEYIKLNTNESPYPPAKSVVEALDDSDIRRLRLYPDPTAKELKAKISDLYNVKSENIFLSNGSDDILNFAFMAFGEQGAMFADITYGFYTVFCDLHGIYYDEIPLQGDFSINTDEYVGKNKMVVIANPNAPTGMTITCDDIEKILKSNKDNVVVIDEAYVDFGGESCYPLISKYDNLLVVRTFSKSRSMAGGRLGYAIACPELINDLEKIKFSTNPYCINNLTLKLGAATIDANDYYTDMCNEIISTREYTTKKLRAMGFDVLDSKANFVFAKSNKITGEELYTTLKDKGILVRHFGSERINDYNRITIGTKAQMDILLKTINDILEEKAYE